jgi:hypothetical protein
MFYDAGAPVDCHENADYTHGLAAEPSCEDQQFVIW